MRKENDFAIKRYSDRLKAETPVVRSSRFSPDASKFKTVLNTSKREGKLPALASSMSTGAALRYKKGGDSGTSLAWRGGFKYHVDSLLLRGRAAARAIQEEELSCEIVSKMRCERFSGEKEVTSNCAKDLTRNFLQAAENRGMNNEKRGNYLDEGRGDTANQKFLLTEEAAKNPQIEEDRGSNSGAQAGGFNMGNLIPGVGPSCVGSVMGSNLLQEQFNLGLGNGLQQVKNKIRADGDQESILPPQFRELLSDLAQNSAFVFGANSPNNMKQPRRWKKAAHVSEKYSFEVLAPQTNFKNGKKRISTQEDFMSTEEGTTKKSREEEDHVAAVLPTDSG
ncbi:hypothetical protein COLO4_26843 [Corchorus olitorius]|uniref:Uncharacterized protein n=1 Tax=Corchorus olitorius TaxID=93759 RepID=A0A1R3HTU4_9ROSI|nr:hypothetical protein COLO4_26843 [Corchorus olitorius]